jgi:hypothetical protein
VGGWAQGEEVDRVCMKLRRVNEMLVEVLDHVGEEVNSAG